MQCALPHAANTQQQTSVSIRKSSIDIIHIDNFKLWDSINRTRGICAHFLRGMQLQNSSCSGEERRKVGFLMESEKKLICCRYICLRAPCGSTISCCRCCIDDYHACLMSVGGQMFLKKKTYPTLHDKSDTNTHRFPTPTPRVIEGP